MGFYFEEKEVCVQKVGFNGQKAWKTVVTRIYYYQGVQNFNSIATITTSAFLTLVPRSLTFMRNRRIDFEDNWG